jgi:hypothetical protein
VRPLPALVVRHQLGPQLRGPEGVQRGSVRGPEEVQRGCSCSNPQPRCERASRPCGVTSSHLLRIISSSHLISTHQSIIRFVALVLG